MDRRRSARTGLPRRAARSPRTGWTPRPETVAAVTRALRRLVGRRGR